MKGYYYYCLKYKNTEAAYYRSDYYNYEDKEKALTDMKTRINTIIKSGGFIIAASFHVIIDIDMNID